MCCLLCVVLLQQIGNDCPDVVPAQLKAAWGAVQSLVKQGLLSAGHDISDGGIATTLLEMAFAGGFFYTSSTLIRYAAFLAQPIHCMG